MHAYLMMHTHPLAQIQKNHNFIDLIKQIYKGKVQVTFDVTLNNVTLFNNLLLN